MLTKSESSWLETYLQPRYPELVPEYLEAHAIASTARAAGHLEAESAARLVELASRSRKPLGENVAAMIARLAATLPAARDAIRTLAGARVVHGRINALVALGWLSWGDLHDELVSRLLRDASTKVRALAASAMMESGVTSLVPLLDDAITTETSEKLRAELVWNRDLLRDGWVADTPVDGRIWVTCRRRSGTVSMSFTTDEFEIKGHEWIASQRR